MTELLTIIVGFIAGRIAERYLSRKRHDHEVEMGYLTGHVDGYGAALADIGAVEL
jgi:uncharacterized membrane protein YeaQ/YmgE (transglycosylase-associated protein family)